MQEYIISNKSSNDNGFLLQFIPSILENAVKEKIINFEGRNLKTEYIVDIVHSFILRYYFRGSNEFNLSSIILKNRYGKDYNFYIKFLLERNIISLKKNYSVGHSSRLYELNKQVLDSRIDRFKNSNKVLVKKKSKKNDLNTKNKINTGIKINLIENLDCVTIDHEKAVYYLKSIITDKETLERNMYSIECIKSGYLFWNFDDFGRFHSNFTILKSYIRKNFLSIEDKQTFELDVPNSQPLFLLKLIKEESANCKQSEIDFFTNLVMRGCFYDFLVDENKKKSRSDIKKMVYQVLFGANKRTSSDMFFKRYFPSIYQFIVDYKHIKKNYKSLSHRLQFMESDFVYNKVLLNFTKEYQGAKFVTVHDSIITTKDYHDKLIPIFENQLKLLYK